MSHVLSARLSSECSEAFGRTHLKELLVLQQRFQGCQLIAPEFFIAMNFGFQVLHKLEIFSDSCITLPLSPLQLL